MGCEARWTGCSGSMTAWGTAEGSRSLGRCGAEAQVVAIPYPTSGPPDMVHKDFVIGHGFSQPNVVRPSGRARSIVVCEVDRSGALSL